LAKRDFKASSQGLLPSDTSARHVEVRNLWLPHLDGQAMHYVLLVAGRLVHADSASQFVVLEEDEW
jgi:hypothetical protein